MKNAMKYSKMKLSILFRKMTLHIKTASFCSEMAFNSSADCSVS